MLPLLEDKVAKQGKTTGCDAAVNADLKRLGRDSLGKGDKLRRYAKDAEYYRTRKTLMAKGPLNPRASAPSSTS